MATPEPAQSGILVPLDGSTLAEHAIPFATVLALPDEPVRLLGVVPKPPPVRGRLGEPVVSEHLVQRMYVDGIRADLDRVAGQWKLLDPNIQTEVAVGDPAAEILRVAEERGCRLIALASHGRGGLGRWTYGSVADRVVRAATCPVLVTRPHDGALPVAAPPVTRVVVPLDGSPLAERSLPIAASVASRLHGPLHLITVLDTEEIEFAMAAGVYPAVELVHSLDPLREAATGYLRDRARELEAAGQRVTHELREGSPADVLLATIESTELIVATTHGRSGIRRWMVGSVVDKLIRHGQAPVLVVRPPDRAGDAP